MNDYLEPTEFIDSDAPAILEFVKKTVTPEDSEVEKAVKLYYAVRDGIKYDAYQVCQQRSAQKASAVLNFGTGMCIAKAVVLAASARAAKIPSRIGVADVRNHLIPDNLKQVVDGDLLRCHGYTELFLNGQWLKATPAFNQELCLRFNVAPLEFDGTKDSIFQEYNQSGNQYMEYVEDLGQFFELPYTFIWERIKHYHPLIFEDTP
jgi:transglutaminase-like putative cysteine protease